MDAFIYEYETLQAAARRLCDENVATLPVASADGRAVGVFGLGHVLAAEGALASTCVGEVMTRAVFAAGDDAAAAVAAIERAGLRAGAVADERGRLVGVLIAPRPAARENAWPVWDAAGDRA